MHVGQFPPGLGDGPPGLGFACDRLPPGLGGSDDGEDFAQEAHGEPLNQGDPEPQSHGTPLSTAADTPATAQHACNESDGIALRDYGGRDAFASRLSVLCCNVPDVAKRELESFLLEWCRRHAGATPGTYQGGAGPQQPTQNHHSQQHASGTAAAAAAAAAPSRLWSGSLSLSLPLPRGLGSDQTLSGTAPQAHRRQAQATQPAEAAGEQAGCVPLGCSWEDRLRPHSRPLDDDGQPGWRRDGRMGLPLRTAWSTEDASTVTAVSKRLDGGGADVGSDSWPTLPGCGAGAAGGGATAIQPQPQQDASGRPNFTARLLLRAQSASAAVAFNNAYERENGVALYDRLRVAPLRLGARGLAASAMPTVTAPPAPASATHGSASGAAPDGAADGEGVGREGPRDLPVASVLAALSPLSKQAGAPGDAAGAAAAGDGARARARKRQRTEGSNGDGEVALGAITHEFKFVLNRCWNCGSYGHDLHACYRPRNQASIESNRLAFAASRAAAEEERAARATAAVARQGARRRHGGSKGASQNRYFSHPTDDEEQQPLLGADPAVDVARPDADDAPLTVAPPWVRPGALSTSLAAALELASPLDPPPWLSRMALHGIPPSYSRSTPGAAPAEGPGAAAAAAPSGQEVAAVRRRRVVIRVYDADGVPLPLPGEEDSGGGDGDGGGSSGGNGDGGTGDAAEGRAAEADMLNEEPGRPGAESSSDGGVGVGSGDAMAALLEAAPAAAEQMRSPELPEAAFSVDMDIITDADAGNTAPAVPSRQPAGSEGAGTDAGLDAGLRELLPAAPRHVSFPGLNAPVPASADREAWGKALRQARQAVAVAESVRLRQQQGGTPPQPQQPQSEPWLQTQQLGSQALETPLSRAELGPSQPPSQQQQQQQQLMPQPAQPSLPEPQQELLHQQQQQQQQPGPQSKELLAAAGAVPPQGQHHLPQHHGISIGTAPQVPPPQQQQQPQQEQHPSPPPPLHNTGAPQLQQQQQQPGPQQAYAVNQQAPAAWASSGGAAPGAAAVQGLPAQSAAGTGVGDDASLSAMQQGWFQQQQQHFMPQQQLLNGPVFHPQLMGQQHMPQQHMVQQQMLQQQRMMQQWALMFQQQMRVQEQMQNGMFVFRGLSGGTSAGTLPGQGQTRR